MTPYIKYISLALAGMILVAGLLALTWAGQKPTNSAAKESNETAMIKQARSTIPAIDAAAPPVVETATLALG